MGILDLNAEFEFAREGAGVDKDTRRDQYDQRLKDGGERNQEIEETKSKVMITIEHSDLVEKNGEQAK